MKRYTEYKDSGVEWLGQIPQHWKETKLKFIGYLYSGLTGKKGEDFANEKNSSNRPFIPFTNIASNEKIDVSALQYVRIEDNEEQNLVKKGDLFFMMSSENYDDVGKTTILLNEVGEVYLNSFCRGFRITDSTIDPSFLNYVLLSSPNRQRLLIEANGFTRINLKVGKINDLKVFFPPLTNEQTQIAQYLDHKTAQIDKLISDKEKLIELLNEERTAIINQAVTKGLNPEVPMKDSGIEWLGEVPEHWEVKRMKYLCDIGTGEKDTENREENGLYPFYVRSQTVERISTYSFDGEAILTAGDGVGVCKVWHYVNEKFDYHQRVYRMSDFQDVYGKFLFWYLKENFEKEVKKLSAKSTVDSLRRPMFENFPVTYPSKNEQKTIIEYIENEQNRIDKIVEKIQKEIQLLKEYKTALISQVVTGKVDVRDELLKQEALT